MFNKKISAKIALIVIAFLVLFSACNSAPKRSATAKSEVAAKKLELAAWKGEWVSLAAAAEDAALDTVYKETAKTMPNYTAGGLKAAVAKMYASPILKAKFDGTNTVRFTIADKAGKETEISCEYAYKGKAACVGFDGYFWDTFEAVKEVRGLEKVKYFIAFQPHKHGEGLNHWHARFGGYSIDSLVNEDPLAWPTYVAASTAYEDIVNNYKTGIPAIKDMLPVSPFATYAEKGKWINRAILFDNKSAEVQVAYDKIIKEFAGKNPKGGNFTKAEIIAEMKKAYPDWQDFSHLEFITEGEKNELAVWKDGKEIFRSSYKRVADNNSRSGQMAVLADKNGAGKFTTISLTSVHGEPAHMHLWYGTKDAELADFKGAPTCFAADNTDAQFASIIENSCRRVLTALMEK